MKQERINYSDIMALGFNEEEVSDTTYFDQFGYQYCIITKNLTPLVYLTWAKETGLCEMIRIDEDDNILARMPIRNLGHLVEIVNFFG